MDNLEYLEKVKKAEGKWLDDEVIKNISSDNPEWDMKGMEYRKTKALEIIAEELIKFNLTANVLTAVVEGITNQGNQLNVNARVI